MRAGRFGGGRRGCQGRDGDQHPGPRAARLEVRQGAVREPPGDGGPGQAGARRVLGWGHEHRGWGVCGLIAHQRNPPREAWPAGGPVTG